MKKYLKFCRIAVYNLLLPIILVVYFIVQNSPQILADIPVDEKLIQIENFDIVNGPNLKMTDTIYVVTKFRAKMNCNVSFWIPVQYGLSLPEDTITNFSYTNVLNVGNDELVEHKVAFVIRDTTVSCLMVSVRIKGYEFGPPIGYSIHDESGYRCLTSIKYYKDTTVSVWKIKENPIDFSIYPNPASNFIKISIENEAGLLPREVQILDLLGLVVTKLELNDGNNRIDISNLPRGTYFIKVGDKVEKFVKM